MRFLVDEMLTGLARALRAAGHDTAMPRPGERDPDIAATAVREGRILITRDRRLAERAKGAVLLREDGVDANVRALSAALPVDWLAAPFSRCMIDNEPLHEAGPADLARMPASSREMDGPHRVCRRCGRVYWPGSHVRRMRAQLERWANEKGAAGSLRP